ncbi:MAG: zinc ribbon domain-containing protein [Lachnospiraceae bacterium]|nr:zinc ribbon domain-containing protein [Lachnospiraceae bacterium]
MFCTSCGNQIADGSAFCSVCGTACNTDLETQNMGYQNQAKNNESEVDSKKTDKRKKKTAIIIGVIVVAIIAVIAVVVIINLKKKPEKELSPQEKVLAEYFEALNECDFEKIYELSYTEEARAVRDGYPFLDSKIYTLEHDFFFYRGFYDNPSLCQFVLDSYPDKSDGLSDEEIENKTCDMFNVSYEIIDIQPFDEVDVKARQQLDFVDVDWQNLEDRANIGTYVDGELKESDVSVDDAYVVRLYIEWSYDDMLYGYDEEWWENKEFRAAVPDDFSTYDEAIEHMESLGDEGEKIYSVVVYESDGEWYILQGTTLPRFMGPYLEDEIRWQGVVGNN